MHRKKTEYFRENGSSKRMSVQTDCEMLSVQAMEAYARKYHVSGNDVVELFHENQVFEKMMIQHEYLHQISFEEVLEYVEKIMLEKCYEDVKYIFSFIPDHEKQNVKRAMGPYKLDTYFALYTPDPFICVENDIYAYILGN